MEPLFFWPIVAAGFGLVFGSFLNVCISRLPDDQPIDAPGSMCPRCGTAIRWYDNFPVLSFIILGGRCRSCRAPISFRYPLVELLTSALFFYATLRCGPTWASLKWCLFAALIVELTVSDLETRILPDEFTKWGLALGLSLSPIVPLPEGILTYFSWVAYPEAHRPLLSFLNSAGAALILGGGLFLLGEAYYRIRGREGLGFGDVKLVALIGAFLGLESALLALVFGSLLGSILGILWIKLQKQDSGYELPFGSFLGVGALIAAGLMI